MVNKTRGIVLHQFSYSDSSVVVKIYTEQFGLHSYMVRGVKKRGKDKRLGALQPLTLVELSAKHKEGSTMHTLSSVSVETPYTNIPIDIAKTGVSLFLAELVLKMTPDNEPNHDLFEFLHSAFVVLDHTSNTSHFHLLLMLKLCKFWGFYPRQENGGTPHYFDMREGSFTSTKPIHLEHISGDELVALLTLMGTNFDGLESLTINGRLRKSLMNHLLLYYSLHLEGMREMVSHKVLEEVFE